MRIGDRAIGPDGPCFIIAEAGVNHNGDIERAKALIDVAAATGCDAVKFQTFRAADLVTAVAPQAEYQARNTKQEEAQLAMLQRLELDEAAHREIKRHADERRIAFLSTPFDEVSADLLEDIGVPVFKVGSGDLTHTPLLAHIAAKGRPMIVSTGMGTMADVERAVAIVEAAGDPPLALLQCVSDYPAAPSRVNLRAMETLRRAFGHPVGYSDHTLGIAVPTAAVALGACIIEKHFTLDKGLPGPDHQASLDPDELHALVRSIRAVEAAMGDGRKRPTPEEEQTAQVARRSLVVRRTLDAGSVLTADDVTIKRPADGIPPYELDQVIGKRLARRIERDTTLQWGHLT